MSIARKILMGAAGAGSKFTYVDDVFSTYLYRGNETARSISNSVDNTEGGMVWIKNRDNSAFPPYVFDTERGVNKQLRTSSTAAQTSSGNTITAFNDNGFSLGTETMINRNNDDQVSWNFRKAKGFFDVVTYTGNGSNRTIDHSLGSVPGMIIIKDLDDGSEWWAVYHRQLNGGNNPEQYYLRLNTNNGEATSADLWNNTAPTSTNFSLGTGNAVNKNGDNYVAYVFAGGDATNIDITSKTLTNIGNSFDGSYPMSNINDGTAETSNAQSIGHVNNLPLDIYVDLTSPHVVTQYKIAPQGGGTTTYNLPIKIEIYGSNDTSSWNLLTTTETTHNGWYAGSYRDFPIPGLNSYRYWRIKVLRSLDSVGTVNNGVSISEWKLDGFSPSLDTPGYEFGENEDQNVIKCGSYVGNGLSTGPEINLGWEPQWLLVKRTDSQDTKDWYMWDSMRGIVSGGDDAEMQANLTNAEASAEKIELTSTGFRLKSASSTVNYAGGDFIYMCIRRPDGYVGKPAEAGTDVFAMDTGSSSSNGPTFDSGFPIDFGIRKQPATVDAHYTVSRLMGGYYLEANGTATQGGPSTNWASDYNNGWAKTYSSSYFSWMWKRGAGFDVVAYEGDDTAGHLIQHSLSKTPEMIWVKTRDYSGRNWAVYHKGLNGGTNPQNWYMNLDRGNNAQTESVNSWNNTAPTSTHMTLGGGSFVNKDGYNYLAMLFASVDGISKVGYYDGSESEQTITTGFQPRFVIIRRVNTAQSWYVLDTIRGWASGVDQFLQLNETAAQDNSYDLGAPTSTGFTLTGNNLRTNNGGDKYIYYCHA